MKEKIQLTNGSVYEFDDIRCVGDLLKIKFDKTVDIEELISDMSIFNTIQVLTVGDTVCATLKDYTTVYKRDHNDSILTLSNDGSVYVEPVIPDPIPIPEPTLSDIQSMKISEFSSICNQEIVKGADVEINGTTEHFSYKAEDQVNIKKAFDLALTTKLSVPLHCDNGNCALYSAEDMIKIYIAEETNLTHHLTYFNQMKQYIKTLKTKDSVTALSYGEALTGEYLDTYNTIMEQAAVIIQAVINGGAK